jgi:hypothetical protein
VDDDFARWRDDGPWATRLERLRAQTRRPAGREPTPRAAWIDRPSVKPTELGGRERGEEGGTQVTGRKRHLVGDTWGVLLVVLLPSAGLEEGGAAPPLLQLLEPNDFLRLETLLADTQ